MKVYGRAEVYLHAISLDRGEWSFLRPVKSLHYSMSKKLGLPESWANGMSYQPVLLKYSLYSNVKTMPINPISQ
jgi:hypothetical protein